MLCWWCDTELIWGGDVDIEKDMGGYPEFSVLTNLSCPKCESTEYYEDTVTMTGKT